MLFLYISYPFDTLSLDIDLHSHPYLRFLRFNLDFEHEGIKESQGDVIQWFDSICKSAVSNLLIVEVCCYSKGLEVYDKIQGTLLALYERIQFFSVYLPPGTNKRRLFPKLYEVGIVTEVHFQYGSDEVVSNYILSSPMSPIYCCSHV